MRSSLRIIDANLNRAREGLRVMEDLARFHLTRSDLAESLKRVRHDLRATVQLDDVVRRAWRDTAGDIGRELTTEQESERQDFVAIAAAAGARVGEALRVIEEHCKLSGDDARAVERLRYRVYELDRALVVALAGGRARQWRLCVLLSTRLCPEGDVRRVAAAALAGGADCLQLREKPGESALNDRELLECARELIELARPSGATVFINDRVDVALLAGAHGVHVGQTDLEVEGLRRIAGRDLLIGVSASTIEQAQRAVGDGADVCGLGPMFVSATKPKPALSGPELVRRYVTDGALARVPHLAISGITAQNVGELVGAGARGVAVSSAICGARDPEAATRGLLRAMDQALVKVP